MLFVDQGQTYNTDHMLMFSTADPETPRILTTSDYHELFVIRMDERLGVLIRRADPDLVRELAQRSGLTELTEALAATEQEHVTDPSPAPPDTPQPPASPPR